MICNVQSHLGPCHGSSHIHLVLGIQFIEEIIQAKLKNIYTNDKQFLGVGASANEVMSRWHKFFNECFDT